MRNKTKKRKVYVTSPLSTTGLHTQCDIIWYDAKPSRIRRAWNALSLLWRR